MREAIPPGRTRLATLEDDMKHVRQNLETLSVSMDALASSQAQTTDILVALDKKVTGNGGTSYDSGDVLQRIAKRLGVWEVGDGTAKNRREGDPR